MTELWLIPVGLRVIAANVVAPTLIKLSSSERGRMNRFFLQYLFAGCIAAAFAAALGQFRFDLMFFFILGIGFTNAIAAYCQWRAIELSISKSHLFTWGDDILAVALVMLVPSLAETSVLNLPIGVGVGLSFLAIILLSASDFKEHSFQLYLWVAAYSVIWGVALFLMRYLAVEGVGVGAFAHAWYWGAFAGAFVLFSIYRFTRDTTDMFTARDIRLSLALAVTVVMGTSMMFVSVMFAPLIVVQPLYLVAEMAFPILIGLFGFGEKKQLQGTQRLYFALAILGSLLIIAGFVLQ